MAYDGEALLEAYRRFCGLHCTSQETIRENMRRAEKLLETLGNLARLDDTAVQTWQETRAAQVAKKTVNLELDVLRQLLDLCQRQGWRADNPARQVEKLPWRMARLPRALTFGQVQQALLQAREISAQARPLSRAGQLYRLLAVGIYFGLRRGELQHLTWADTNGRQVYVQGKALPGGREWLPKDREARVIQYAGIERPIAVVFDEEPQVGYVFSPAADRSQPFDADSLSGIVERVLRPLAPDLTLHSLRHTFATWRLEMGDSLARVRMLMGHGDLTTLQRYAHIGPDPLADLLPLLTGSRAEPLGRG